MAITVQQIFEQACDLMDKRSPTGTIDATKTSRYKVRVPNILNIWQSENSNKLDKTYEINCVATNNSKWVKYAMPSDFRNITQIIKIETFGSDENYERFTDYKFEETNDLYVNSLFEGTIRIIYKPIPTPITTMSQEIGIDYVTSVGAAYFLAAHLLLTEDPSTASFFNERYMEYNAKVNVKNPATIEDIIDVYR